MKIEKFKIIKSDRESSGLDITVEYSVEKGIGIKDLEDGKQLDIYYHLKLDSVYAVLGSPVVMMNSPTTLLKINRRMLGRDQKEILTQLLLIINNTISNYQMSLQANMLAYYHSQSSRYSDEDYIRLTTFLYTIKMVERDLIRHIADLIKTVLKDDNHKLIVRNREFIALIRDTLTNIKNLTTGVAISALLAVEMHSNKKSAVANMGMLNRHLKNLYG